MILEEKRRNGQAKNLHRERHMYTSLQSLTHVYNIDKTKNRELAENLV